MERPSRIPAGGLSSFPPRLAVLNAKLSVLDLLRPPGEGLLTLTSGRGLASRLLGAKESRSLREDWPALRARRLAAPPREPLLLGVPSDTGGGICRGAAHGPLHIRAALYRADAYWRARDIGDIPCIPQLLEDGMLSRRQLQRSGKWLWKTQWRTGRPVAPLNLLEESLVEIWRGTRERRVLVLGGDHSITGAVFAALARSEKMAGLGVLHIDAHTDLLEERFGVQHGFATWAVPALRLLKNPAAWVQVGIRASARERSHWETTYGLRQFWAQQVRHRDPRRFALEIERHFLKLGCRRLYITNDIDGTDARFAPATGTDRKSTRLNSSH